MTVTVTVTACPSTGQPRPQALQLLVAGAGIGGLAAALACARQGLGVQVLEQAAQLSEVGAGIQLGPNATRVLMGWGLGPELARVGVQPRQLQARDALTGAVLASLPLAGQALAQYGAPYVCVHRADVQALLLHAAHSAGVQVHLGQAVHTWQASPDAGADADTDAGGVSLRTAQGQHWQADALVGADGLWSRVRAGLLGPEPPRWTGHVACRALVAQADWPAQWRSDQITVWMAPGLHWVQYPVRGGEWLNVVAVVHTGAATGRGAGTLAPEWQALLAGGWDAAAQAQALAALGAQMALVGRDVRQRFEAVTQWRCWALHERPAVPAAAHMAQGPVALLGDAAHPMRPYGAQGAAMAIEDAQALAQCLAQCLAQGVPQAGVAAALQRYAQQRWARNARVQTRSQRNGQVFHAQGLQRLGRNAALRLLGGRLMDVPWLYGAGR